MYERFYGLRERPFELTPDPRFLFLSAGHHEALTHLKYGLSGRPGITMVIGDAGMGKTTLIEATLQSAPAGLRVATLSNPTLTRTEFYDYLARAFEFRAEAATSKTEFLEEMEGALDACTDNGVLALIVDEAQSLPSELLEELRLLTNVQSHSGRSLTLVLVGQPELAERLNDPSLRQLKQRVALRAHLAAFTLRDTAGYIASRITVAGGRADHIFSREAVQAVHEVSKGLPRVISVICDNALVSGFAAGVRPVGSTIISEVCADFDLTRVAAARERALDSGSPTRTEQPPVPSSAAAVVLPTEREMFSARSDTNNKRFSFFRGARR